MACRSARSVFVSLLLVSSSLAMTPDERKEYREKFLTTAPKVDAFSQWVQKSDALPPDFDSLPKQNELPDPFKFLDGRPVQMPQDWEARRAEIRKLFEQYMIGSLPPKPKIDRVVELDAAALAAEAAARGGAGGFRGGRARGGARGPATDPSTTQPGNAPIEAPRGGGGRGIRGAGGRGGAAPAAPGSITRTVDLKYGPGSAISTRVTLTIPPGDGPFPVLIGGAPGVTNRGYIACSWPTSIDMGFGARGEESDDPYLTPLNLKKYYPDITAGSMGEVAWTAQMVVDYLYSVPQVEKAKIAITGYSRWGKLVLLAAAIDERITAVIAGSTGVGGVLPWRYSSESNNGESIESTTRMFPIWYRKDFRFFVGREDRLPVDANLMLALVAPRPVLMLYGLNDEVSNTWGDEKVYYDTVKVFETLGHAERLSILRPEGHHGANDEPASMHWLDIQFGKSTEKWTNDFMFPWNWAQWKQKTNANLDVNAMPAHTAGDAFANVSSIGDWETKAESIRTSEKTILGTPPSDAARANEKVSNPGDAGIDDTPRWVINRSIIEHGWTRDQAKGIATKDIRFGVGGIRGDFYFKQNTPADKKLPAIVYLHGFSYPLGYMNVYRTDPHPIIALANAGYAVLAYDQSGFGSRMNEAAKFYDKNPQWSQMGRLVEDARAAVAAAMKDPIVDPQHVYVFGFGIGGAAAIHAAALDPNIKGIVSICGFTPMRTDSLEKGSGGIARYFEDRGIIPNLGFFSGNLAKIPYDYPELISTIAPRSVYVYSPLYNREATAADVKDAVTQAGKVFSLYNASGKLVLDQPWDYFRLSLEGQDRIVKWMSENMK